MHRSSEELESSLAHILDAPADRGPIELIAIRPSTDQRTIIEEGKLDTVTGLVGDNWGDRGDPGDERYAQTQVTLMRSRVAAAISESPDDWPLAGDQIYVDMDLSVDNLPPGTRLQVGEAVIEVAPMPHTGCSKFAERFGADALRFVNVGTGRDGRFRGLNAFVVEGGSFRRGDEVVKLPAR